MFCVSSWRLKASACPHASESSNPAQTDAQQAYLVRGIMNEKMGVTVN